MIRQTDVESFCQFSYDIFCLCLCVGGYLSLLCSRSWVRFMSLTTFYRHHSQYFHFFLWLSWISRKNQKKKTAFGEGNKMKRVFFFSSFLVFSAVVKLLYALTKMDIYICYRLRLLAGAWLTVHIYSRRPKKKSQCSGILKSQRTGITFQYDELPWNL